MLWVGYCAQLASVYIGPGYECTAPAQIVNRDGKLLCQQNDIAGPAAGFEPASITSPDEL